MRPTAASAQKTHDKPASPPRTSTKAPVSALQKGKKKVEEVAAKAKDDLTSNGHHGEENAADGTSAHEESNAAHDAEASETEPTTVQEQASADTSAHEVETDAALEVPVAQATEEAVH
jgi:hypothetical protein